MKESAPVANYTNELIATRFSDVMWLIEQIMWKSLDKRVASFLLDFSRDDPKISIFFCFNGYFKLNGLHDT